MNEPLENQIKKLKAEAEVREAASLAKAFARLFPPAQVWLDYVSDMQLQRLEEELRLLVQEFQDHKIQPSANLDPASVQSIVERWVDAVKRESREAKRRHLRTYMLSTCREGMSADQADERLRFLNALDSLSALDCDVLSFLCEQDRGFEPAQVGIGTVATIAGSFKALESFGFVDLRFKTSRLRGVHSSFSEAAQVTDLGRAFRLFCIRQGDHEHDASDEMTDG